MEYAGQTSQSHKGSTFKAQHPMHTTSGLVDACPEGPELMVWLVQYKLTQEVITCPEDTPYQTIKDSTQILMTPYNYSLLTVF